MSNIYEIKKFNIEDYNSGDGMLTSVWGPSLWHFLHMMSFNYPINPSKIDKINYKNFIKSLQFILPCRLCRENLVKNFKTLPITNKDMKNRESFSRYVYNLHELINKMLSKKSGLSYEDVRDRYEHFRSRCVKNIKTIKKNKKNNNKTIKKKKENGCIDPLYGTKSKCLIQIVPIEDKTETFRIDEKCYKKTIK